MLRVSAVYLRDESRYIGLNASTKLTGGETSSERNVLGAKL